VEEIPDGIEFHAVGRFNDVERQDEPERITAGMHVKGWKKDGAYSPDPEKIEKNLLLDLQVQKSLM
jgi:hypothetical protein